MAQTVNVFSKYINKIFGLEKHAKATLRRGKTS